MYTGTEDYLTAMQDQSQNHIVSIVQNYCAAMGLGIDLHRDINVDNLNCISLGARPFLRGGRGKRRKRSPNRSSI